MLKCIPRAGQAGRASARRASKPRVAQRKLARETDCTSSRSCSLAAGLCRLRSAFLEVPAVAIAVMRCLRLSWRVERRRHSLGTECNQVLWRRSDHSLGPLLQDIWQGLGHLDLLSAVQGLGVHAGHLGGWRRVCSASPMCVVCQPSNLRRSTAPEPGWLGLCSVPFECLG